MRFQWLRKFHRDEQGQIIYLTIASVVVFVSLAALVINSGNTVTRKTETQNAVDAAALTGATWVARGMNIISMNNVAMTEMLGFIVVLRALNDTWDYGLRRANAILAAGTGVESVAVARKYFEFHKRRFGSRIDNATRPGSGELWMLLNGLEMASTIVKTSFPLIAVADAERIGKRNKAELVVMYPLVLGGLAMPVEQGSFSDLCHPTRYGSPSSYPRPLQRGYVPLQLMTFARSYSYDKGPLMIIRDVGNTNRPLLQAALAVLRDFPARRRLEGYTQDEFAQFCSQTQGDNFSSSRDTPKPFLLKAAVRSTNRSVDSMTRVKQDLNYLSFARRPTQSLFMQARFANPQKYICAYGQVRVYNSTSFDLFTQDWRAKLVRAEMLENSLGGAMVMTGLCEHLTLLVTRGLGRH